jgi:hypothetical protein
MNLRILAVVLTALALGGCAASVQPRPAAKPTPTSTVGAWDVNMNLINQVGAAGTASFTFADGHTKVVNFTEAGQDLTERDLVLVGQSVTVAVNVTKMPKNSYIVCSIAAFELTVATEGAGTLVSGTGTRTGKFTCAWTNDGTLVMPKPEE